MRINDLSNVQVMPGEEMILKYKDPTLYTRIKYLHSSEVRRELHFFITRKSKIIADAALQPNPYNNDEVWLKHISVDEKYRNNGLAGQLLRSIFKYCLDKDLALVRSSPSELGKQFLPSVFDRLSKEFPDVKVVNSKY